ncbi:MAG: GIY-YIG nuclease family protein, partial [Candidatus Levybacteria bacterium]|nr:GIY-YIG nuclease family protein [Candidatus Levybacteria bacterium]
VYLFLDENSSVLYVGKAKDLKSRVSSYFVNDSLLGEKTRLLVSQIKKVKITVVESELESLLLEAFYIKKYSPKYNVRMADDKSYPLIRITIDDAYPKVLFARRTEDKHSLYFGPYPNSGAVKNVLKIIRRVFPYQSVFNHPKRVCLYHHLGLCPCPIVNNSRKLKKEYRRNIRSIIRILEGKSQKIMRELERDRERMSKAEHFEEAQELQRKIQSLSIITQPYHRPFEYDVNPNLRSDIREQEMATLQKALSTSGKQFPMPYKIECYDISNIQGTNATGSMVVFVNGEKQSSLYRKYKIRRENTPNDFAMIEEVLQRRIKHREWPFPDLIIVDGGKGQVSAALRALGNHQVEIPLVGLAKREETIIIPINSNRHSEARPQNDETVTRQNIDGLNFAEISLPKNSPALHLIQRIRDEAHRFAITYHRLRRGKHMFLA